MAVRCALGYIQVGGGADDAADAASSPSRFALGRRSQAHTETDKRNTSERKRGGAEPSPLNRLGIGCRFSAAHGFLSSDFALPFVAVLRCVLLCHFRELCDHFGAYRADILSVLPTSEVVREDELLFVLSIGADDVLVHDVRHEVAIQPSRINEFFARLFQILRKIPYRLRHFGGVVYGIEIIPPEHFAEENASRTYHPLKD